MTPPVPIPDFAIRRFQETGEVALVWPVVPQPPEYALPTSWWSSGQTPVAIEFDRIRYDFPVRPGDVLEVRGSPYGRCPRCNALGELRERRPNGNDTCHNGHVYPSRDAKPDTLRLPVAAVDAKRFSEVTEEKLRQAGVGSLMPEMPQDPGDDYPDPWEVFGHWWNEQHAHLGPAYLAEADPYLWMITCKGGG
jgi:hypothetical protein